LKLFDDFGPLKKRTQLKELPPVLETGWKPPQYFPDLSSAALISFDTETWEKDFDHGPGWARGASELVGFSVAAQTHAGDIGSWYFPINHKIETEWNLDGKQCLSWLKHTLESTPQIPKVGANLIYDIGTLSDYGIWPQGELHDVQVAEPLIDDRGEINLDHLGLKYCGIGKETSALYDWIIRAYNPDKRRIRGDIYRSPPRLVGYYAEQDAALPIHVLQRQWPILTSECLHDVYRMECDLIRLWVRMRIQGAAIDIPKAERLYVKFGLRIKEMEKELAAKAGREVNVDASDDIGRALEAAGIQVPFKTTEKGKKVYSVTKPWLEKQNHPIVTDTLEIRKLGKINSTFIKSYFLERHRNGVVHCSFNPLRKDGGGTETGRLSSDNPNLQNIPVRTDEGKMIRECFTYHYGHYGIEQGDQSQIEYRYLAHFAVGPGADALREQYNNNPDTDYHDATYDRVCPHMGWDIMDAVFRSNKRRPIKNINFGLVYGMGGPKLASDLKLSREDAKKLFGSYHEGNPYVKETMKDAAAFMQRYGYTLTVLGRRRRYDLWEPMEYGDWFPLPFEAAVKQWGPMIHRANEHTAINSKLQGSAADQMKKAAQILLNEGVYDFTGVPMLQVHDEWVNSRIDNSPQQEEAFRYIKHVNETCIPLRIPLKYERGFGNNWNEAK
jgi:DNA polymerase I-like protein with 3'-5' exonuclease and polymerase domains